MEVTISKISVDHVQENAFKPELDQAQIRQIITKSYPSVRPNTGGLYNTSEYGLSERTFEENRVSWVDVPKGKSVEEVQAQIDTFPQATIWRKLSSSIILTENDQNYLNSLESEEEQEIFLQKKADSQQVVSKDGEIILHNGKPQHRRLFFSTVHHEDEDVREKEISRLSLQPQNENTDSNLVRV